MVAAMGPGPIHTEALVLQDPRLGDHPAQWPDRGKGGLRGAVQRQMQMQVWFGKAK